MLGGFVSRNGGKRRRFCKHTKESDQVATLGAARGKYTSFICNVAVLPANLDRYSGTTRTCLDGVCGSELDEIGHTDTSVLLNSLEVPTQTLKPFVLPSRALICENQRSITRTVEAVVE